METSPGKTGHDSMTITEPSGVQRTVPLTVHGITIGRGPENDLVLAYSAISRQHAQITHDRGHYYVTDLNSANGTFIGETPLSPDQPARWVPGEILRIDGVSIQLIQGSSGSDVALTDESSIAPPSETASSPASDARVRQRQPPPAPPRQRQGTPLDTAISILISIVAIACALVAWRASLAGFVGADNAAIRATMNAELTQFLNTATMYRHYRAYSNYVYQHELEQTLEQDLADAASTSSVSLDEQLAGARNMATINQLFFPSRYINRDGIYNIERELGEGWAETAQKLDLNPEPHLERAEQRRIKSLVLKGILIVKALALMCLNMAKILHPSRSFLRYTMISGGTLLLIAGIVSVVVIEIVI